METSVLIAAAGLIVSPAASFLAVKISVEVIKVRIEMLVKGIETLEKDFGIKAIKVDLLQQKLTSAEERIIVLEREIKELKIKKSKSKI